jgi:hypothetical protein
MPEPKQRQPNRYQVIILRLFENHYTEGLTEFEFTRNEFVNSDTAGYHLLLRKIPQSYL